MIETFPDQSLLAVSLRLLLACILGGMIGLEREIHGRPAGFRTHLMVSLGSCLFVVISIWFYRNFGNFSGQVPVGVDPGRVAAQVVTGIGFLGAGAIIREGASIRGLTTAACLWVAAGIGMACGAGLFAVSALVTAFSLASLLLLKRVETRLARDTYGYISVRARDIDGQVEQIAEIISSCGLQITSTSLEKNTSRSEILLQLEVKSTSRKGASAVVNRLASLEGMESVKHSFWPTTTR